LGGLIFTYIPLQRQVKSEKQKFYTSECR
jgi:hypothetical protein